ncbi:fatty acid hydroxylase family protein, partial [Streptomyces sp. SID8455]|nr:fatty acid hydroxylase family protein [Streptomyces sp. SID8455]
MDECERSADGEIDSVGYSSGGKSAVGISPASVLRVTAYPLLLLAVVLVGASALVLRWDPAIVSPLFLVGTLVYLAILE